MTTVFVSSQRIDLPYAHRFIATLRERGFDVRHSRRNPLDGDDSRSTDWYTSGLRCELGQAELFVIVLDAAWDSSTAMAVEAEEALTLLDAGKLRGMYYVDPEHVELRAGGMLRYLKTLLPDDLDAAVTVLSRRPESE